MVEAEIPEWKRRFRDTFDTVQKKQELFNEEEEKMREETESLIQRKIPPRSIDLFLHALERTHTNAHKHTGI